MAFDRDTLIALARLRGKLAAPDVETHWYPDCSTGRLASTDWNVPAKRREGRSRLVPAVPMPVWEVQRLAQEMNAAYRDGRGQ